MGLSRSGPRRTVALGWIPQPKAGLEQRQRQHFLSHPRVPAPLEWSSNQRGMDFMPAVYRAVVQETSRY